VGAVVNKLPPGSKLGAIYAQKYYEQNRTFYKEEVDQITTALKSSQMTLIFTDRVKNNLWSSVKSARTELKMKFIESRLQLVEKFSMPHN
jgi:hypothetical protein